MSPAKRSKKSQAPFSGRLVLNRWALSLFEVQTFDDLAEHLRDEALGGLDENKVHHFHSALVTHFPDLDELPEDLLLEYDQNIVSHTIRLNESRLGVTDEPIVWKYFQYLALLFSEVYLDRYFNDPSQLRAAINEEILAYNAGTPDTDRIAAFDVIASAREQLNKLAYWSATGSGKTLLMHANILQYQHYLKKSGGRQLDHVILLTPNEGLSRQHLAELHKSGFEAELFTDDSPGLFAGNAVEIIDIHKLREEKGEKTISIQAFEGNNLVLVDEGHRGASSGTEGPWLGFRNALCENGFSFEYSATFGQAIKGNDALINLYARSILIDYSYRYFYGDGFGKDYQILNVEKETQESQLEAYLVACLLSFFQQQRLYSEQEATFRPFDVERPLWVFVGSSVAALGARDASDIIEVLRFLARYLGDPGASEKLITQVLNRGLVTASGRDLFENRFPYLNTSGLSPEVTFRETLATLFNAPRGGALYVENLKGAQGELALRVGDNPYFGVINVGDDGKLAKLCQDVDELVVTERDFSSSLFHEINEPESTINMLIGSKKFTEGWNSWRVSTMGLMNVGRSEGSQIIQLFGRGVRLKGYGKSLKRSTKTDLPSDLARPEHLGLLETLSIFGVHADYMAQFRDFLQEEGLPSTHDRIEILLPVIRNLGKRPLKTIRLQKTINGVSTEFGDPFRRLGPIPTLRKPDGSAEYLQKNRVLLNWYPKVQAMKSGELVGGEGEASRSEALLSTKHVAFLDIDRLYFELQRFKAERGWHNLNLTREAMRDLLLDGTWYRLQIPEAELGFDSYANVRVWEEVALALLKKYTERYYTFRKKEWELPHLAYQELAATDPNLIGASDGSDDNYHRVVIDESETEIVAKLGELKKTIEAGNAKPWEFRGIKAVWFSKHLYEPLLYVDKKIVDISPVPLNNGERLFVEDLKAFHDNGSGFFKGKELYLLRNLSRGKGVGFFEAGNFHPDFILWLVTQDRQRVVFVDPKGIRNLGSTDPKIEFHKTIKDIEKRLGDSEVELESFIVSNTDSHVMEKLWNLDKQAMAARNIVFQQEDKDTYVRKILEHA